MYIEYTLVCVQSHKKCVLCTLLPFIKAFKIHTDDGTVSVSKHVAVSQYNSCVERKSRVFQSVRICGLGYNPKDQETVLISDMGSSVFFFHLYPRLWSPYSLLYSGYSSCFSSYSERCLKLTNSIHYRGEECMEQYFTSTCIVIAR
jgi:hypothetical protein